MEQISKKDLRRQMLDRRDKLEREYCIRADQMIFHRLTKEPVYEAAGVIFVYVSTEKETDTRKILADAFGKGKTVAVPRCVGRGIMRAYEIRGPKDLRKGLFQILEPGDNCREVKPEEIDLAVVPCVSCSPDGARLGYGGGYYDRYLSGLRAVRAAVCREKLICDSIPTEPYDCFMDLVITEKRISRVGRWENEETKGIITKNGE